MRRTTGISALLFLPLLLAGCDRGLGSGELARAGDFVLTVEEAATYLAPAPDLQNDVEIVDAVAQFWTDYTLLAWAVNQEGGLEELDLTPQVQRRVGEAQILRLRDEVIQVDTVFTQEEVLARYEVDRPGEEVSARHILFAYPAEVTEPQRDSIRAVAQGILERVRGGGDFAALAREFSQDPGSGANGGDLGPFGRGAMVAPFEEAAFALEVGEVSDLVETDYGVHIIRVDDRRLPPFEEVEESFRSQLAWEAVTNAETSFVEGIETAANAEIAEGAVELVRKIAENVSTPLPRRDANQEIVTYEGGAFTGKDFQDFLMNQGPDLHQQIVTAPADQLEPFLLELTRGELLIADAVERGITISEEETTGFRDEFIAEYVNIAQSLGIDSIAPGDGESLKEAIDREVKALLGRMITGEAQVVPLGPLAYPLRVTYGSEISEEAKDEAVARVEELRGAAPAPAGGLPTGGGVPMPPLPADTTAAAPPAPPAP